MRWQQNAQRESDMLGLALDGELVVGTMSTLNAYDAQTAELR